MSRPRAAMSVATSARTRPCLKSASARVRAFWLLLPWIAALVMPSASSCVATRLARCLVRVNTSTWRHWPVPIRLDSSARLCSRGTA